MTALADRRTLEALDFASVRDRVIAGTRTQRAKARAHALEPHAQMERVRVEQRRTAAARELVASADLHVGAAVDTAELTAGAALGRTLGATELRAVGDALAAAAAAYNAARESEVLAPVLAGYAPLRELQRALTDAIDERGVVLDRASPALGRIRRGLAQAGADARDRVGAILRSAKYAKAIQDTIVTLREGRFVVPVKAEFAGEFPGIVHDTSASGQTLFIEPLAALDANNRVRTLRIEEEREVQRVLEDLSRRTGAEAVRIESNVEMLAELDLLVAKANVARAMDAIEPELSDEALVRVVRGRHPLLGERAVPQSLALDDATRLLVISGPNMGGKTVALKMVGLFVAMTYCGMQLPAAPGTAIGSFARVLADIGDEQSIADNASTFSAHLQRMRELLGGAGPGTLAIVDEIGGGTEPTAGAALAIAMLERLLESGARGVVTTHATELKLFAHGRAGVANASVRFDPATFQPTFHLDVGAPGQSLAFPLARKLGIDAAIVERAQALLEHRERDYETALAELSLRTAELEREREGLAQERGAAAREREELAREREGFERERRGFAAKAEERMQQALRDYVGELQRRAAERGPARPKVTPSQSASLGAAIEAMRRDLGIVPEARNGGDDGAYAAGARVRVLSLAQEAEVVEDYGGTLLVAIGPMKMVVEKTDVRRIAGAAEKRRERGRAGSARLEAATRSQAELDVRGKRFAEAEPLVERWIDEAVLAGNSPVRLIHGKGTGMLGRGLQEYLRLHPSVKSVRYGNETEGSSGVTIVELA
ncbi:MAG TPA: endonuclease MutS2 [Verrucomicrobiae bacterium]|nr:endonuclease MutS2 [Verrucomicrobiae bacterium]